MQAFPVLGAASQWGTVPQWGTFATVALIFIALLIAIVRVLPALLLALNERRRDAAAEDATATEQWRVIAAQVGEELKECRQARKDDAEHFRRLDDELFRTRLVLSMTLDHIERQDPDAEIILKAKAIMMQGPTPGEAAAQPPESAEMKGLMQRLSRFPGKAPRRRAPPRESD